MQTITPETQLSELIMHANDIIRRHALGILKEARRSIDTPPLDILNSQKRTCSSGHTWDDLHDIDPCNIVW